MREALIKLIIRMHKAPWEETPTEWGKTLWLEEDFIHELQDLIEEPIFEESETIAEGMEKLRELYGEGVL